MNTIDFVTDTDSKVDFRKINVEVYTLEIHSNTGKLYEDEIDMFVYWDLMLSLNGSVYNTHKNGFKIKK